MSFSPFSSGSDSEVNNNNNNNNNTSFSRRVSARLTATALTNHRGEEEDEDDQDDALTMDYITTTSTSSAIDIAADTDTSLSRSSDESSQRVYTKAKRRRKATRKAEVVNYTTTVKAQKWRNPLLNGTSVGVAEGTGSDTDTPPQIVRVVEHHHTMRSKKKDWPPRRRYSLWWAAVVIPFLLSLPLILVVVSVLFYPVVLSVVAVAYAMTWTVYLKYAQDDLPPNVYRRPYLPLNPIRIFRVDMVILHNLHEALTGPTFPAIYHWFIHKLNTPRRRLSSTSPETVFKSIPYNQTSTGHGSEKLDLYTPVMAWDRDGKVIGVKKEPLANSESRYDEGYQSPLSLDSAGNDSSTTLAPVIVYIYGGAWISGSKAMYSPMAQTLVDQGYIVVVPNYTLYPKGKIYSMVSDVKACIQWTCNNVRRYGGDPDRIHLMGHGSGAHLAALTVVHDSALAAGVLPNEIGTDANGTHFLPRWNTTGSQRASQDEKTSDLERLRVHSVILFAGVFDLTYQYAYETTRGIEELSGLARCVGNTPERLVMASPSVLLARAISREGNREAMWNMLPKNWLLVHGDKDNISPTHHSRSLFEILCKASGRPNDAVGTGVAAKKGADIRLKMYNNIKHLNPAVGLLAPNTRLCSSVLKDIKSIR